jgi:hypothetical protein
MKRALAYGWVAIVVSGALAACGGDSSDKSGASATSATKATSGTTATSPTVKPGDGGGGASDPCSLLTDDDVTAVIGAHKAGVTGVHDGANYGDSSCVWDSTGPASPASGTPDQVEVSVLTGDIANFAREQDAKLGEPFPSFGHNAQWMQSYARLWFDCGDNQYCHVRVGTAASTTHSGASRQDAAVKLGQKLLGEV